MPAVANADWLVQRMISLIRNGWRCVTLGEDAHTAVAPKLPCRRTACFPSRAVDATRWPTSFPPALRAMPANATPKSPSGCGVRSSTKKHSSFDNLRSLGRSFWFVYRSEPITLVKKGFIIEFASEAIAKAKLFKRI